MNNKLFNSITGKDKREYNRIIKLIDEKNYIAVIYKDKDTKFCLSNQKYVDKIIDRIKQEVLDDPEFLVEMNNSFYHRASYFNEIAIKANPKIVETLIEKRVKGIEKIILMALDNGYKPSNEYVFKYSLHFCKNDIMEKLLDNGFVPTDEMMESFDFMDIFKNEKFFTRALDWGYIPSTTFLLFTKLLSKPNLVDRILDIIELTPEVINSEVFLNNKKAQQKVIKEKPELLLKLKGKNFSQFWSEALDQGYIPQEILNFRSIVGDFYLFSKIVKRNPKLIKFCQISETESRKQIDELALSEGYIPSISDIQTSQHIKSSPKLMEAAILRNPEAVKYVETRPLDVFYYLELSQEDFFDLVRLAISNGYIPTLKDIENNPRLIDSFDIMKILIQKDPKLINEIEEETENKEELLKIAIENGFNDKIVSHYRRSKKENRLLSTETAIIYQLDNGLPLDNKWLYNNYSIKFYNYLIDKGYQTKDIINLFARNVEVMKKIISDNPEYINSISTNLSREEIDELGLFAIKCGYVPKFNDRIFGYGYETAKLMVKTYPSYLEKVELFDKYYDESLNYKPCKYYDEICKIAVDAGFFPNTIKFPYNYSYDIMKKAIPLHPSLIEDCKVEDKNKYDELCRLAISSGYMINKFALNKPGSKISTNYDLMASYVSEHPDFLLFVKITNSDELLKLIDIAISSGLDLNSLNERELFQLFIHIDESKWPDYLDGGTIAYFKKVKASSEFGDEVSDAYEIPAGGMLKQ